MLILLGVKTTKKLMIKNNALLAIADALISGKDIILSENLKDVRKARLNGMSESMVDRLALTEDRITAMAQGVAAVAAMDDPVGKVLNGSIRPNGLKIEKVAVPLGVIAIIYEASPYEHIIKKVINKNIFEIISF